VRTPGGMAAPSSGKTPTQNRAFEWAMSHPDEAKRAMDTAGKAADAVDRAGGMQRLAGAAVVGAGIATVATGSIVLGAAAATGAAYAATRNDKVGEVARATGDAAVATFQRAKDVDREHQLTARAKEAAVGAVHKARELDGKYHLADRAKGAVSSAKRFEQEHRILDSVATGVTKGLAAFTKAVQGAGTPRGMDGLSDGQLTPREVPDTARSAAGSSVSGLGEVPPTARPSTGDPPPYDAPYKP